MGHSAGAYMAAMLALDGRWLGRAGLSPVGISRAVGISGPYDFLPFHDQTLKAIFGGANDATTQPITYVAPGAPPAFCTGVRTTPSIPVMPCGLAPD